VGKSETERYEKEWMSERENDVRRKERKRRDWDQDKSNKGVSSF